MGIINPYYWVDDHPLLYGSNGSLDPIAHVSLGFARMIPYRIFLVEEWGPVRRAKQPLL